MAVDIEGQLARLRRVAGVVGVIVVLWIIGCSTTTRIDAGHVGIKVKLAGSDRGVQNAEVAVGWVFYNPLTEQIIQFPTSVQNIVWTASPHEGQPVDESITFSSNEGVNINADIGLSFHIDPPSAPKLYARFRQNDLTLLAYGYMRNTVREAFNDIASKMPVQEIYGAGKSRMVNDVTERCRDILGKDGVIIDQLTINGALRLPQNVAEAINRAMEATQKAIESENRVRQVKAEAEQAIAQAHGQAEAAREKAQGEADSRLINARAEAKANEIIRLSVSPAVLQYRMMQQWDGKLPSFNGGGQIPMLTIDATKFAQIDEAAREKRLKELLEDQPPSAAPTPAPPAPPAQR